VGSVEVGEILVPFWGLYRVEYWTEVDGSWIGGTVRAREGLSGDVEWRCNVIKIPGC
jgi:hypothetical protein